MYFLFRITANFPTVSEKVAGKSINVTSQCFTELDAVFPFDQNLASTITYSATMKRLGSSSVNVFNKNSEEYLSYACR